jgi:hypothetical protein
MCGMSKDRASLAILYKSGARIDLTCDDYTLTKNQGELVKITLDGALPKPLLFGIDDIVAVWRTDKGALPS